MLIAGPTYYTPPPARPAARVVTTDVCIYGGTSAGVIAAVELGRQGKRTVVLVNGKHVGGLTTGGLSYTDIGNKGAIGGLSREFYQRLGAKYGVAEEWKFEPHVAQTVMDELLHESGAEVFTGQYLKSVRKRAGRIEEIATEEGLKVRAGVFIDASYEGDLMARAGVSYTVGRESNSVYGETLDGVQVRDKHQFDFPVDPYVKEGDPKSGVLPGINPDGPGRTGEGDKRIQAYNFRLCLTTNPDNRIPFEKPAGYDPQLYVLHARYLAAGWRDVFRKFDPIRGDKVDMNNHGATSSDFIGMNYEYPSGDYRKRERIFQDHVRYQQGLMWFLANDPQSPEEIRAKMSQWGLCKDEFTDTGGWPPQLYVREARRMVSDYVMNENDCRGKRLADDPVGLGSYTMDSHNCQRFVQDGKARNEGDVQVGGFDPYPVSYRAIAPRRKECANLLVPVCVASSHIAYGSIRMEPVFMVLGQSAAVAAAEALNRRCAVQDVPYADLRIALEKRGQVLAWKK